MEDNAVFVGGCLEVCHLNKIAHWASVKKVQQRLGI